MYMVKTEASVFTNGFGVAPDPFTFGFSALFDARERRIPTVGFHPLLFDIEKIGWYNLDDCFFR